MLGTMGKQLLITLEANRNHFHKHRANPNKHAAMTIRIVNVDIICSGDIGAPFSITSGGNNVSTGSM